MSEANQSLAELAAGQAEKLAETTATLTRLCQASAWPTLSTEDIDDLVLQSRRADKFGRSPNDSWWIPTYHVAFGAMRGWQLKAGYVATAYDTADGQVKFDRSQALKGCQEMVKMYSKRCAGSMPIIAPQRSPISPIPAFPVGPAFMPTEFEQGNQ